MKKILFLLFTLSLIQLVQGQNTIVPALKVFLEDAETGNNIPNARVTIESYDHSKPIIGKYDDANQYYYFEEIPYNYNTVMAYHDKYAEKGFQPYNSWLPNKLTLKLYNSNYVSYRFEKAVLSKKGISFNDKKTNYAVIPKSSMKVLNSGKEITKPTYRNIYNEDPYHIAIISKQDRLNFTSNDSVKNRLDKLSLEKFEPDGNANSNYMIDPKSGYLTSCKDPECATLSEVNFVYFFQKKDGSKFSRFNSPEIFDLREHKYTVGAITNKVLEYYDDTSFNAQKFYGSTYNDSISLRPKKIDMAFWDTYQNDHKERYHDSSSDNNLPDKGKVWYTIFFVIEKPLEYNNSGIGLGALDNMETDLHSNEKYFFSNNYFNETYQSIELESLPEEYAKNEVFLEILKKYYEYQETKTGDEVYSFSPMLYVPNTFDFNERRFNLIGQNGKMIRTNNSHISYQFKNQHLINKSISFYNSEEFKSPFEIYYDKNGKIRSNNGKIIKTIVNKNEENPDFPTIQSPLGYYVPVIDLNNLKIKRKRIDEIKIHIAKMTKGYNFKKSNEDFSVEDWKKQNEMRDYLKKQLNSNPFKNLDIYYNYSNLEELSLEYENGVYFTIYSNFDEKKKEWTISQLIRTDNVDTYIQNYANGNVKSIRQLEGWSDEPKYFGMYHDYNKNGSPIRIINLEEEFKLKKRDIDSILMHNKKCKYGDFTGYTDSDRQRYLHSNYGKIWISSVSCTGKKIMVYISDTTKEIYDYEFKVFSVAEYEKLYNSKTIKETEKQLNAKILIVSAIDDISTWLDSH